MIALDTNVLLRYILEDDPVQSKQAVQLIAGADRVLIVDAVLVETVWTLRGAKYKASTEDIAGMLVALFEEPNLEFENDAVVWQALSAYRDARRSRSSDLDFADALIFAKARYVIESRSEPFAGFYSFDKAALKMTGTKRPG